MRELQLIGAIACLALAGCVTGDPLRADQYESVAPAAASPPATTANTGWQMVLPVTGGVPILALPLGGTVYLPATGDPPVVGTPLFP
jgi:hypothetical protein